MTISSVRALKCFKVWCIISYFTCYNNRKL